MADVSVSELRSKIKGILDGADLSSLSAKKVRLQLQTELQVDLSDRKKEIDGLTMELILARDKEDAGEDENGVEPSSDTSEDELKDSPPAKKAKKTEKTKTTARPKAKQKKAAKSVHTAATVDSDEEDDKVNDEELAQRLQAEEEGGRRTRHRSVKKTPTKKKKKDGEKKERKKGTSTYSRPCLLSPELAKLMGKDKMARNEVVKRMWEITRERNLQDQKDRRFIICDDELHVLFGRRRVQTFGMMKYLKSHISDIKDLNIPISDVPVSDGDE